MNKLQQIKSEWKIGDEMIVLGIAVDGRPLCVSPSQAIAYCPPCIWSQILEQSPERRISRSGVHIGLAGDIPTAHYRELCRKDGVLYFALLKRQQMFFFAI